MSETPLHQKLEQQFESEHLLPELEAKKQMLAEKREFMRPMDAREMAREAKRVDRELEEAHERAKQNRLEKYETIGAVGPRYKPSYTSMLKDSAVN